MSNGCSPSESLLFAKPNAAVGAKRCRAEQDFVFDRSERAVEIGMTNWPPWFDFSSQLGKCLAVVLLGMMTMSLKVSFFKKCFPRYQSNISF